MRAYFFGNMYLSSIQQGIQAAHVVAEMATRYSAFASTSGPGMFTEWATDHKTMILLNAGYSEEIRNLKDLFQKNSNQYPWAYFHESDEALDGALTCVGIILPEKIYGLAKLMRTEPVHVRQVIEHNVVTSGQYLPLAVQTESGEAEKWDYTKWEWALVTRLNQYGMAA